MADWRNGLAHLTTDQEVPGSSPGSVECGDLVEYQSYEGLRFKSTLEHLVKSKFKYFFVFYYINEDKKNTKN